MSILFGYIISYFYVALLIFGIGPIIKRFSNVEISRKCIHISLFALWIFIDIFLKGSLHQFILPFTFIVINALSFKFKLFKTIERENDKDYGTIIFAISVFIVYLISYFYPETYIFTFYAIFSLTIGDGFASLFGHLIKSSKIYYSKSLSGFLSCIVGTFIAYLIFNFIGFKLFPIWYLFVLSILTGIFELIDIKIDNLLITLGIFGIAYLSNLLGISFQLSILYSVIIFILVFFTKAITYYGSLLSSIYVFCFSYLGGLFPLIFSLFLYFLSVLFSLIKRRYYKNDEVTKKQGKKDVIQILSNGIIPLLFLLISFVTKDIAFLIISLFALAANFVDSLSSDIGSISKSSPIDIIRWKQVQKGLSGGITALGTIAALIASLFLSFIIVHHYIFSISSFTIAFLSVFLGTIMDSIFGSRIQNKNICIKCNLITEKNYHCDEKCAHYSGVKWINNDLVNLFSSIFVSLFALTIKVVL